jgi:hypothetical protein
VRLRKEVSEEEVCWKKRDDPSPDPATQSRVLLLRDLFRIQLDFGPMHSGRDLGDERVGIVVE